VLHTHLQDDGRVGNSGTGLFAAAPLRFGVALGLGLQFVDPPATFDLPAGGYAKLSLAAAFGRPDGRASIGLAWHHLFSDDDGRVGGLDTIDVAFQLRPCRWLAAGLVVRDLSTPRAGGAPVQRRYEPEVALRPLGSDPIEVGLGARVGQTRDVAPRVRLTLAPRRGIVLRGEVEVRRDGADSGYGTNDVRAAVGIELNLHHVGIGGALRLGSDRAPGDSFHGGSVWARLSAESYPSLGELRPMVARLKLGSELDERVLVQILDHLHRLQRDPNVAGLVLIVGNSSLGWGRLQELRAALRGFRSSGKHVLAYLESPSMRDYYLASVANRILLNPGGGLQLLGLSAHLLFFKDALAKLGANADFIRIAEYKSAPESYIRQQSSEPARRMRNELLDDLFAQVIDDLTRDAVGRPHHTQQALRALIDAALYVAPIAQAAGLVDALRFPDEVDDEVRKFIAGRYRLQDVAVFGSQRPRSWSQPAIAIVHVDGDIVDGKSRELPILGRRLAGGATIAAAIASARRNPRVRAIVLRVNSPGGSVLASDRIAREVALTRGKKPIVVSMGDVAASGGYYVSALADRIYALPSTITGSIGIFTGKVDVSGIAAKLGIGVELYERGAHAAIESPVRPYSEDERQRIYQGLRHFYNRFLQIVSTGRHLPVDRIDAIARGHVWTGRQARQLGLVDELGGLPDVLLEARRRAGLGQETPVQLLSLPLRRRSLLHRFVTLQSGAVDTPDDGEDDNDDALEEGAAVTRSAASWLPSWATELMRAIPPSLLLAAPDSPLALLPFEVQ
jgi:protease-4